MGLTAGQGWGWGGEGYTEIEENVLVLKKVVLETGHVIYNSEHLQKSTALSL